MTSRRTETRKLVLRFLTDPESAREDITQLPPQAPPPPAPQAAPPPAEKPKTSPPPPPRP